MAIYLKYDGIDGDSTAKGHEKWFQLDSFSWGVGRAINTPVGRVANREASEPSVSEITFVKQSDASSIKLFQEATTGNKGKLVKIHFVETGDVGGVYMEYELEDTFVSGYSLSSGGDRPTESISLNFAKVTYKYNTRDSKGNSSPASASYDLRTTQKG